MCFYHDYDWLAEVYEAEVTTHDKPLACDECDRTIPAGARHYSVHMEEHEECQSCEWNGDPDEVNCTECECEEPDHGKTYDYVCCLDCRRVLEAIEAVEVANGCKGEETRPALTQLREAMAESRDAGHYAAKALEMYPDLAAHVARLTGDG